MKNINFTLTNQSCMVHYNGKMYTVAKGQPNFLTLRQAILDEDEEGVIAALDIRGGFAQWAKGRFTFSEAGESFFYDGQPVPASLNKRLMEMATKNEDPSPLFKFYERLQLNPSWRSVQQLFNFLVHAGIPFTKDGMFLAYKGLDHDYNDKHTHMVSNKPGTVNQMPRNQISDDPKEACHVGFHVGALSYAQSYSAVGPVVVCKVDPADVVSVPYDEQARKVRVCKYTVVGNYGDELPSTVYDGDLPEVEEKIAAPTCGKCNTPMVDKSGADEKDHAWVCESEKCTATHKTKKVDVKPAISADPQPGEYNLAEWKNKTIDDLAKMDLGVLRTFAARGLKIVGASKIPGGKAVLIAKILQMMEQVKL